jgi:DNA-binding MltR family transcriptional regulator
MESGWAARKCDSGVVHLDMNLDKGSQMENSPDVLKGMLDLFDSTVSREEWEKTRKELAQALTFQDRVEGIIHVCTFDDGLELLLRTAMIENESIDELMKDGQVLQSFSSKVKLAYALGLLPADVRDDLQCLNKIRNYFAHERAVTSFDKAPICDLCANLSTAKRRDGTVQSPREAHRSAVFENWLYLRYEILRRKKERTSPHVPPHSRFEYLCEAYHLQQSREPK